MTLGDLFVEVSVNAEYMDIYNYYDDEPKEKIRLPKEILNTVWQESHDAEDVECVVSVFNEYKEDNILTVEECDKMIKWLDKTVDCIDLVDGKYEIVLYEY